MASDDDGNIVDPYGGRRDLEARLLRHVSPAFVEDPLRVLRVARFASRFAGLGFTVAPETVELMRGIASSGELAALVPERVWVETERALGEQQPSVYFEVLRACGALEVVFPEIAALYGVPQPQKWHPEIDTGLHTMQVLEVAAQMSGDTTVRFAALVHDVGKGLTPREQWPSHIGHEEAGAALIERLCARLRAPNEHRDLAVLVARQHAKVHRVAELRPARCSSCSSRRTPFAAANASTGCSWPARRMRVVADRNCASRPTRRPRCCAASVTQPPQYDWIRRHVGRIGLVIAERMRLARIDAIRAARAG